MAYQVNTYFQVKLTDREDLKERLNAISEEQGCLSASEILETLLDNWEGKAIEPIRSADKSYSTPSKAGKHRFECEIDPLDLKLVERMREDMYREYRFKDAQILAHWAKVHGDIGDQVLFMLRPPKNVREKIIAQGQPAIDEGEFRDLGQYMVSLLRDLFRKKNPPKEESQKGGSWW